MPITLDAPGTPLWQQVLQYLATDTHPTEGLVAALGAGANSLFPNFETAGPSSQRDRCPTPFLILASGGVRARDRVGRELRVHIEVHDDSDQGEQRRPGIVARLIYLLAIQEYRPTSDRAFHYVAGTTYESTSPPLEDQRYQTVFEQLTFCSYAMDRTSARGYQG